MANHLCSPAVGIAPLRRCFFTPLVFFTVIGLFPPSIRPAVFGDYTVREVAPHTFLWLPDDIMDQNGDPQFSRAVNVGFIITSDGVVVIDTANNPFHAREILYEIRQRTDLPVRLVIDLGPQGDQMLGNEVFAEQRATIVSTAAAAREMRSYATSLRERMSYDSELQAHMRGIHFTLPTQTFQGDTKFRLGNEEILVTSLNCGTSGDAVAYLPRERVLFLGDFYVNGYVPEVGARNINRWITALADLEKWNATLFVPGHGAPDSRSGVANFRGFLEWLSAGVAGAIRQGETLSEAERQLLRSPAFNLRALELAPGAIREVYEQFKHNQTAHAARREPPGAVAGNSGS